MGEPGLSPRLLRNFRRELLLNHRVSFSSSFSPSDRSGSRVGVENACVLIPAYNAERTLGAVVDAFCDEMPEHEIIVIDDGSTDATRDIARGKRCALVSIEKNSGKGAALKEGFRYALSIGFDVALTVDADGQHPAASAKKLIDASPDPNALVLAVRDLARMGAPKKNRFSNGVSNYFVSLFSGTHLSDTQCGLRRYPIARTLELAGESNGYAFEAEVLMRAVAAQIPIVECTTDVLYPPDRTTHFNNVKDPMRMIVTVLRTAWRIRT